MSASRECLTPGRRREAFFSYAHVPRMSHGRIGSGECGTGKANPSPKAGSLLRPGAAAGRRDDNVTEGRRKNLRRGPSRHGGQAFTAAGKLTQGRQGKRKNPHTQHRRMGHPAVQRATRLRGWASVGLRVRYNWWRDSWRGLTWLGGGGIKAGRLGGECLPVLPRGTAERLLRDTGDAGLRGRRVRCESSGDAGLLLGLVLGLGLVLDLYS